MKDGCGGWTCTTVGRCLFGFLFYTVQMLTIDARKLGAARRARQQREEAVKGYLANPNICKCCKKPIPLPEGVKVSTIRKNRFCSKTCSAKFHNVFKRPELRREPAPLPLCKRCKASTVARRPNGTPNVWCSSCAEEERLRVGKTPRSQMTHPKIRSHARYVLSRNRLPDKCDWCGYSKHVECCHLKPVAEFSASALMSEVNDPSNLRWLCPNCHWELDHGLAK